MRTVALTLLSALATVACRNGAQQPTPREASRSERALASRADGGSATSLRAAAPPAAPAPSEALADPSEQFLVHRASGEIALRARTTQGARVLAPHADAVLLQNALELLWFRDQDRLSVLDLRSPDAPAVLIARGMPEVNRLSITHPEETTETEDGCDLAYVSLRFGEQPTIEGFLTQAPNLRIENAAWLRAQLARPPRAVGQRRDFGAAHMRLPKRVLDCEEPEACGTTVAFAGQKLELVRVLDRMGGDCFRRACLLHDPNTDLFASPPDAQKWARAEQTARGPCGLFRFDRAQTAFLLAESLCVPGQPCEALGGSAIGWRIAGDTVGAPGAF